MHVDDALDDGEPKAGRAFAGGGFGGETLEAAEQPAEILRRQAGALVGDADRDIVLFNGDLDGDLAPIGLYLMALLTRLSIASRMRSASHIVVSWFGAATVMACCLFTASGWLASATSRTKAARS